MDTTMIVETVDLGDGTTMEFIRCPAGVFQMGSPQEEAGHQKQEGPVHPVEVSEFWLARHPVTVAAFRRFVEETRYITEAEAKGGADVLYSATDWGRKEDASWRQPYTEQNDRHPVVCVSWNDATGFCRWLSRWLSKKAGVNVRLPTEAEWEYACRAGTSARFFWGDDPSCTDIDRFAVHYGNSGLKKQETGLKLPNAWGFHDMSGLVWEWCTDWYAEDYYQNSPRMNPAGPEAGQGRSARGGSWYHEVPDCRSAYRIPVAQDYRDNDLGFRVAISQR